MQHKKLYTDAVRKHQKDLRKNIDPMGLLKHISYVQKDRIEAAMRTRGTGEAVDTFLGELMFPQRDNDWPKDFIDALESESQSLYAKMLQNEYADLLEKEFREGRSPELKEYYATSGIV